MSSNLLPGVADQISDSGNGEFQDVDKMPPLEAIKTDITLPRPFFDDMLDTFDALLKIVGVRMADGRHTDRFCSACEMFPMVAHHAGNVTCNCACHRARELLATLKGL